VSTFRQREEMEIGTEYAAMCKVNGRILNPLCMWISCMECARHLNEQLSDKSLLWRRTRSARPEFERKFLIKLRNRYSLTSEYVYIFSWQ
jgi:hypothetical protein